MDKFHDELGWHQRYVHVYYYICSEDDTFLILKQKNTMCIFSYMYINYLVFFFVSPLWSVLVWWYGVTEGVY